MTTTIRVLMAEQDLKPGEVWSRAGISRSRWYALMKRPSSATVAELQKLAHVLGTEPADLIGRSAA